jgi:multidrug efflux pump subunit AcrB
MLLAVKEYKAPLIAGTLTTLVAFLPLMFLPGVM